jgi:hypothetical protein
MGKEMKGKSWTEGERARELEAHEEVQNNPKPKTFMLDPNT